ncbi:putative zinc/iron permease [Helianthus debilis subsp. tardiflorus]
MTSFHHRKTQIYTSLLLLLIAVSFNSSFGHQCQHSHESHNHVHAHHHHHHHHDDGYADLGVKKLPEELAEEEDLRLENNQFMSRIDHGYDHGVGLWIRAMGCSLLVSLASLICLILLPLIFFQGKPSKVFVDSLAVFGAGAMLGDAFLHQLPHAFGGGHSHAHDDSHEHSGHDHSHSDSHSHSHSIEDLSVGLSILFGIVVFLLVEKIVRYVEERSGGTDSLGHGHHHHHRNHKKTDTLQDTSETTSVESSEPEKQSESVLRKRNISSNGAGDSAAENGTESNIEPVIKKEPEPQSSNLVFGYLNLISDGVHNFTDGMALGSAFLLYGSVGGWSRTLFLLAHELPQEIGDFGILVRSGFTVSKALFFNFLSALVALAGTALALSVGQDPGQSSLIEGITAGGFIYIAVGVMAEMNNGSTSLKTSVIQLISLVAGMSVALFISLIE